MQDEEAERIAARFARASCNVDENTLDLGQVLAHFRWIPPRHLTCSRDAERICPAAVVWSAGHGAERDRPLLKRRVIRSRRANASVVQLDHRGLEAFELEHFGHIAAVVEIGNL